MPQSINDNLEVLRKTPGWLRWSGFAILLIVLLLLTLGAWLIHFPTTVDLPVVVTLRDHKIAGEETFMAKATCDDVISSKLSSGKSVQIRLNNYPYTEFGIVRGRVLSVSKKDEPNVFYVSIELPEGLMTTTNKSVQFAGDLTGRAIIVTADVRLADMFFNQFKSPR